MLNTKCDLCGESNCTVQFHEHYVFCTHCTGVYTKHAVVEAQCGHVNTDTPVLIGYTLYRATDKPSPTVINRTDTMHTRCSECAADVYADSW